MKKKIIFVAFAFCAYACSGPKNDGSVLTVDMGDSQLAVVSLNKLKSNTVTIPLSALVESCEMVQLESTDEAFIKSWYTTVTEKYIGVREQDQRPYKLFSRSGKFLGIIGSIGQGPEEYATILYDDIIDENNGLIYLAPFVGDKILVYNTSGKFIKDITAPSQLNKPKIFLSDNILTVLHMPMPFNDNEVMAVQFDVNTGTVLKEMPPSAQFIVTNFDGELFNTRNTPATFDFLSTSSDTLYHFDINNNTILPVLTVNYSVSEPVFKQYFQLNKDLILTWVSFLDKGSYTKDSKLIATDLKKQNSVVC